MSQQDSDASQLHKAEEVIGVILPACHDPSIVLEPGEEAFYLPTTSAPAQRPAVLSLSTTIPSVWSDQFDATLRAESIVQTITVVGSITDHSLRCVGYDRIQSVLDERYFMRRSACNPDSDRKTMAVDDCHDLGALSALSSPDQGAPFLAPAKVPSMKVSVRSRPPRSWRSRARAWSTLSSVPSRTHD